jgi:GNAT superfamily N-acetyltransferase
MSRDRSVRIMTAERSSFQTMPDMLVNLLKLPPLDPVMDRMKQTGIVIRRGQPFEISKMCAFVEQNFSVAWADEISVAFANKPVSLYIATIEREMVGFAAYECTRRNFFGPEGVVQKARGRGIGEALLLASLHGLRDMGYVYGIIGRAGPIDFYQKAVGAMVIPDSDPGIYENLLK